MRYVIMVALHGLHRRDKKVWNMNTKRTWNGGSPETALAAAQRRTDEAIAAGCPRCTACKGDGGMSTGVICPGCGGAGFLVPPGGMPIIRIQGV